MADVFIVPFHVKPATGSIMPEGASGAYVSCYTRAANYEQAVEKCIAALRLDRIHVEDILQPILAMDASQWSIHVTDQWPQHATQLPDQAEFEAAVVAGKVIYGPFGAY